MRPAATPGRVGGSALRLASDFYPLRTRAPGMAMRTPRNGLSSIMPLAELRKARAMRTPPRRLFSAASSRPIPLIDLSHPPELAAREIHAACRSVGFFQILGHGVPETLRARVLSEAAGFFALPQSSKDELSIWRSADKVRGYQRIHENVTQGAADWHEGFDCFLETPSATAHHGTNLWPAEQPSLRLAVVEYVVEMQRVGAP